MDCQKAQYLIQEYLEDELKESEQIKLAQHLLECAECREEMNQMEQADTLFSSQPLLTPPERLRENIMAQLDLVAPEVENVELERQGKLNRFWYILLSFGQIGLAVGVLIVIRPEWFLPAAWLSFLKRIGLIGWNWLLALKAAGENLLGAMTQALLSQVSFGSGIYDFFVQPFWVKLSLLFILLVLTFYLNRRLLFARRNLSGKV